MEEARQEDQLMWVEPPSYRRLKFRQLEREQPLKPLGFAFFVFLALVAVRTMAGLSPQPGHHPPAWPIVIPVSLAVAAFTAYVLPRIAGRFTKYVAILSDQGVNLNSAGFQTKRRFYSWEAIGYCQFMTETFAQESFEIVNVFDREGNWVIELALNGNGDQVRNDLVSRGARVE